MQYFFLITAELHLHLIFLVLTLHDKQRYSTLLLQITNIRSKITFLFNWWYQNIISYTLPQRQHQRIKPIPLTDSLCHALRFPNCFISHSLTFPWSPDPFVGVQSWFYHLVFTLSDTNRPEEPLTDIIQ